MSTEKNVHEAKRWLKTGSDDLETAAILKDNQRFASACFHAQQAAEKAIKAIYYIKDADPWGHSNQKLIGDLKKVDADLFATIKHLKKSGMILDRFYIPTRYPNGLPDLTPAESFTIEDAENCIQHARKIISLVEGLIN